MGRRTRSSCGTSEERRNKTAFERAADRHTQRCVFGIDLNASNLHHRRVPPKKTASKAPQPAASKAKRARTKPGAPSTQDLYTGMSGQFVAMSEFLWRGYNVAVPAVDVGEDIFVVEAENATLRRVQVKTAGTGVVKAGAKTVQFTLSRSQLNLVLGGSPLFFMLLARWDDVDAGKHWRFILIRRDQLNTMWLNRPQGRPGRPPAADSGDDATAWGHSFKDFLDRWPLPDWPVAGPMKSR